MKLRQHEGTDLIQAEIAEMLHQSASICTEFVTPQSRAARLHLARQVSFAHPHSNFSVESYNGILAKTRLKVLRWSYQQKQQNQTKLKYILKCQIYID